MFTRVAFDKFDQIANVSIGKYKLHDTMGIIYQNIKGFNDASTSDTVEENVCKKLKKKMRTFQSIIEKKMSSYCKKV